ncbi:MAG: sel1 repeat family protein [Clostridiales bacterium]|nr:sel1 repeat family protein [Clostridiales bacterium]
MEERKARKTELELFDEARALLETPDYAKGVEMIQNLAENGYERAMIKIGAMYRCGEYVEQNEQKADEWCERVEVRHKEILEQSMNAAKQGEANAQYDMGYMYYWGDYWPSGIERDYVKAAEWFRKAVEQGHAKSQYMLGIMYLRGKGVEKDKAKAEELIRKAAERGVVSAQYKLQELYRNGGEEESRKAPQVRVTYADIKVVDANPKYNHGITGGDKD